jgi:hypothetical protein
LIVVDQAHRLDTGAIDALLHHAEVIAKVACVVLLIEEEPKARHALARASGAPGRGEQPTRSVM